MCGEKKLADFDEDSGKGSPPRMRGKVAPMRPRIAPPGITPACAGKRSLPSEKRNPVGDHPRVCGEKNGICRAKVPHLGSPPRVRGKGFLHFAHKMLEGITPAYAGKSKTSAAGCPGCRDHPRVCGEKALSTFSSRKNSGSPPRMRGKACLTLIIRLLLGITPAYAGKSLPAVLKCPPTRDHPRVCGEKYDAPP